MLFDSKAEATRYLELKFQAQQGFITELCWQPTLDITVNGLRICTVIPDFSYVEAGNLVYEDVKGVRTAVFNLKKKLAKAVLGIDIRVVKMGGKKRR